MSNSLLPQMPATHYSNRNLTSSRRTNISPISAAQSPYPWRMVISRALYKTTKQPRPLSICGSRDRGKTKRKKHETHRTDRESFRPQRSNGGDKSRGCLLTVTDCRSVIFFLATAAARPRCMNDRSRINPPADISPLGLWSFVWIILATRDFLLSVSLPACSFFFFYLSFSRVLLWYSVWRRR